ncbi:unnamed protein product [Angiostrongylus costaricensis]|uniref:SGL domain-containing protein n=1 Tax=Angiostrongylus costaricensis TaxID=334426 RepID=A0A0R3PN52_ANGCS|nr:unnamed protein product [Angiostrongylus costaricensis]
MRLVNMVFYMLLFATTLAQLLFNPWNPLNFLQQTPTGPPYYLEYFKNNGYKTDDKGNVWLGEDNAKFMVIARSSYP